MRILEIGAGSGDNLLFFKRTGIKWENIYANEIMENRVELLRENLPTATILPGNALDITYGHFDVVFQSTVFSSILSPEMKVKLAEKLSEMTNSGGIILWYDFKYDNPANKNVKGVKKKEIRKLFPNAKKIEFHNVTLAPPIGRRIGKFYNFINTIFPFLRTHIIAAIHN